MCQVEAQDVEWDEQQRNNKRKTKKLSRFFATKGKKKLPHVSFCHRLWRWPGNTNSNNKTLTLIQLIEWSTRQTHWEGWTNSKSIFPLTPTLFFSQNVNSIPSWFLCQTFFLRNIPSWWHCEFFVNYFWWTRKRMEMIGFYWLFLCLSVDDLIIRFEYPCRGHYHHFRCCMD